MSTRGCIAERIGNHWRGVYQHSDSYPTWLGPKIWDILHDTFKGDIRAFLDFTIKEHDGGWSRFPNICYCHGHFAERDGTKPGEEKGIIKGCECNRKPYRSDSNDGPICDPLFIEWVYILDPKFKKMAILSHIREDLGKDNCLYKHQFIRTVSLNEEEPYWQDIECGENLERCTHYKWYHDNSICKRCDGLGLWSSGGHSAKFCFHNNDCISINKIPKNIKNKLFSRENNNDWHINKSDTKWVCDQCKGTGKNMEV